jgi:hypothetical protein
MTRGRDGRAWNVAVHKLEAVPTVAVETERGGHSREAIESRVKVPSRQAMARQRRAGSVRVAGAVAPIRSPNYLV